MTTLATWAMIGAILVVAGFLLWEVTHPADGDQPGWEEWTPADDEPIEFTISERTDLLIWNGEMRGEW